VCLSKKERKKKQTKQNEKNLFENKITNVKKHTHAQKDHLLHKSFALYVTLIVIIFLC
jgi:hypothetical protein